MKENSNCVRTFVQGQRVAFAAASLTMGIVSCIHVLGAEKGILAVVFGWLALKGKDGLREGAQRTWAIVGIVLGSIMIILVPLMVTVFWPKLKVIVEALEKLS
jgi:hypothetical protein